MRPSSKIPIQWCSFRPGMFAITISTESAAGRGTRRLKRTQTDMRLPSCHAKGHHADIRQPPDPDGIVRPCLV